MLPRQELDAPARGLLTVSVGTWKDPTGPPSSVEEDNSADLGSLEDQADPESRFALVHQARAEAQKAFVHLDTSTRVQRALLRNAKPLPYTYSL